MSAPPTSPNKVATPSSEDSREGVVITPRARFEGFDSFVRWIGEKLGYFAAGAIAVALVALYYLDQWILLNHGSTALGQAVMDEAEVWIAAAATVGLWATARHVRGLAAAIRYRALTNSASLGGRNVGESRSAPNLAVAESESQASAKSKVG